MKDHSIYLDDILDSIEKIEAYTDGVSEDEFTDLKQQVEQLVQKIRAQL